MFKKIAKGIGILVVLVICLVTAISIFGDDNAKDEDAKLVAEYMNQLHNESADIEKILSQYERNVAMAGTMKERVTLDDQVNSILVPELQKMGNKDLPQLKSKDSQKAKKLLEKLRGDVYLAQEAKRMAILHVDSTDAIKFTKESEQHYSDYKQDRDALTRMYNLTKNQ